MVKIIKVQPGVSGLEPDTKRLPSPNSIPVYVDGEEFPSKISAINYLGIPANKFYQYLAEGKLPDGRSLITLKGKDGKNNQRSKQKD